MQQPSPALVSQTITEAMGRSSWIRKMFEAGAELKKIHGPENVYDLSLGNPVIEPPTEFFEALADVSNQRDQGFHRYMANAGYDEVRETIANDLTQRKIINTDASSINMCVGAGGGLNVLFKALLNPGDEVIILAPYFVEYLFYITNHGGKPVTVQTDENFDLDLEALRQQIRMTTRAVVLCSPNNPSGTCYSAERLRGLQELLTSESKRIGRPILLISDEPYREIYYGDEPLPVATWNYPNSAVVYSWSKSLSIPGDRIGYVALAKTVSDPGLKGALTFCTRILGFVNAPATMQHVVRQLIDLQPPIEVYRQLRDTLVAGLDRLGISCPTPMGAFYAFPKVPEKYGDDDVTFVRAAQEAKVLVVPGSGFGRPGHFRISYAVEPRVVDGALENLAAAL